MRITPRCPAPGCTRVGQFSAVLRAWSQEDWNDGMLTTQRGVSVTVPRYLCQRHKEQATLAELMPDETWQIIERTLRSNRKTPPPRESVQIDWTKKKWRQW